MIRVAVLVACVALSGCMTMTAKAIVQDLTPEQKSALAMKFIDRCGGTVNIGANGGTGQMGGGFTANFQVTGTCPVPEAPKAVPLSQLGQPGTGTEPPS